MTLARLSDVSDGLLLLHSDGVDGGLSEVIGSSTIST